MPVKGHFSGRGQQVDVRELHAWIEGLRRVYLLLPKTTEQVGLVVIERVGHTPIKSKGEVRQNPKSMFSFGDGFGLVRSLAELLDWPREYPLPQAWQRLVLGGLARGDTKKAALSFVSRRYPGVDLLKSGRSRKPHDGIVDALCLMEYGRRVLGAASTSSSPETALPLPPEGS